VVGRAGRQDELGGEAGEAVVVDDGAAGVD
jgi:hypothetical protein